MRADCSIILRLLIYSLLFVDRIYKLFRRYATRTDHQNFSAFKINEWNNNSDLSLSRFDRPIENPFGSQFSVSAKRKKWFILFFFSHTLGMWLGCVVNEQCVVVTRTASNAKWKTKTGSLFTALCTEDAVYSKTTQKELNKNIMCKCTTEKLSISPMGTARQVLTWRMSYAHRIPLLTSRANCVS